MSDYLDLYDYRCRTRDLAQERWRALAAGEETEAVLTRYRTGKDQLFAHHPQSALDEEQRGLFGGLHYFPYNPALRFVVEVDTNVEPISHEVVKNASESMTMLTVGRVHFSVDGEMAALSLYWLDLYGGGLFLPFRDLTCPDESYGGGRYLFDTIKGNDFQPLPTPDGSPSQRITLDFNYAYNPSCAYDDRWVCPLAPPENRLHVALPAGEKKYHA